MDNTVKVLIQAIQDAGKAILALQQSGCAVSTKPNHDLVTQADIVANDILKNALIGQFPNDGWLSEETLDDPKRLTCQRVWVVDPIDGTIEFAKGIPEYAISVALVENRQVILSAVFNPATNELFHAIKGQGAWFNHQKIGCRESSSQKLTLLASRSEYERGGWDVFQHQHDVKVIGSIAYKLALVAAGKADATFSLGTKNEWDIAAGTLLVEEAGGVVTDKNKNRISFNQANVLVNGIVGSSKHVNDQLFSFITMSYS